MLGLLAVITVYAACFHYAEIDLGRLWVGLPKLVHWIARAWPLDLSELDLLLFRAAQTAAKATIGTSLAVLIAGPLCLVAARNVMPESFVYLPARWLLNLLHGIDSFVFALLFVAAVGPGPFAGVLGIGLHSAGSIAKLWSEAIEMEPGPLEAVAMTGAGRLKLVSSLLPNVLPALLSTSLYIWEFNIRSSTVLGLVGAGGIGQDLRNAVDLLDFPSVATINPDHSGDGHGNRSDQCVVTAEADLTTPTIQVQGLGKRYDRTPALSDVSFTVMAGEVVALIGPSGRADRLSGGQQQRVAIARVLAQESRVILADEPGCES